MIKVSTSWSILLDKFDLMNKLNFDLMIENSISWISTSWPWVLIFVVLTFSHFNWLYQLRTYEFSSFPAIKNNKNTMIFL
jgi:hypothetical protein